MLFEDHFLWNYKQENTLYTELLSIRADIYLSIYN